MPRVKLAGGGYVQMVEGVRMDDPTILEVGHPEYGCTSVELADLAEIERVAALVAHLEGDDDGE